MSTAPALRLASTADAIDRLYAADAWRAGDLGVPARRGRDRVTFAGIEPAWLREALKQWARQRLACGCSFNTITTAVTAMRRFSLFLAECTPPAVAPGQITRPLIERYLAWVAARPLADASKNVARVYVRAFLNDNKRYGWAPAIPSDAVIYLDELSSHKRPLPRFLPESVMAQLESDASLARLALPYRHLVVVITETGLRAGDACTLASDTLITDSAGWPCLRVQVSKMRAEHLVPLSARAADAVRAQQAALARDLPEGTPWLFPSAGSPRLPVAYSTLRGVFNAWQERIGLHDEAGRQLHVTLHQLRHTFGTRLINSGVPQHVIQRLMCHASPEMTNFYAHLHDTTIRAEFERYCQTRVDIEGKLLGFDPSAATADAEWVKHRLSRAADTLPNGYCGRPPQQDCPHPNACLTCPDFQTTIQFLPIHQQQARQTRQLLAAAEAAGRERLAANHRKVLINLDKIITSLEALRREAGNGDA